MIDNPAVDNQNSLNISFPISQNENIIAVFSSDQGNEVIINEINYNSDNNFFVFSQGAPIYLNGIFVPLPSDRFVPSIKQVPE